jgi:dolichol kinase
VICAISATLIEAISPPGYDNLTVPLLTTMLVFLSVIAIYPAMLAMILTP